MLCNFQNVSLQMSEIDRHEILIQIDSYRDIQSEYAIKRVIHLSATHPFMLFSY